MIGIGDDAFTECVSLTSVILPHGMTSIAKNAFSGCIRLNGIVIPTSVTEVRDFAFSECRDLTRIYYMGSLEQWESIQIGNANHKLIPEAVYCYTETKPTEPGNYWHYVDGVATPW